MTRNLPPTHLPDDHIDLLITAAAQWGILASRTAAAFAPTALERHVLVATATEAGRLLRAANTAAVHWLSEHGRTKLVDRTTPSTYSHRPVETLRAVEVIKAAHAAQSACEPSPEWEGSATQRLLRALVTAACHRLEGYPTAPWLWTRPQHRTGRPIGAATAGERPPPVPGLEWVDPTGIRDLWGEAAMVVLTPNAALAAPGDLPPRSGVFVLAQEESSNQIWQAVESLDMQALVLFWPTCREWLTQQLADPIADFTEHRGQR